jgi:hypothetical protein
MLSLNGIIDGQNLILNKRIVFSTPKKVIITFLDEDIYPELKQNEIMILAVSGRAFNFLDNENDDIYSDNDLKVKY